jgi:hypothetical protein
LYVQVCRIWFILHERLLRERNEPQLLPKVRLVRSALPTHSLIQFYLKYL